MDELAAEKCRGYEGHRMRTSVTPKRSLGAAGSDNRDMIIGLGETSKKTILIIAKQTRLGSYRLNLEMLPGARKNVGSHLPQVAEPQDGKPLLDTC